MLGVSRGRKRERSGRWRASGSMPMLGHLLGLPQHFLNDVLDRVQHKPPVKRRRVTPEHAMVSALFVGLFVHRTSHCGLPWNFVLVFAARTSSLIQGICMLPLQAFVNRTK
jgi:hypothetical protein